MLRSSAQDNKQNDSRNSKGRVEIETNFIFSANTQMYMTFKITVRITLNLVGDECFRNSACAVAKYTLY